MEHSSTRQISDIDEWTEVRWHTSKCDFVCQNSQHVLYALRDSQPVKTDDCISVTE